MILITGLENHKTVQEAWLIAKKKNQDSSRGSWKTGKWSKEEEDKQEKFARNEEVEIIKVKVASK